MISKKLEKIARQYRIDPATLPHVDDQSVTINIAQPAAPVVESREARQSEHERLKALAHAANERLREYTRAERERRIAAKK